MNELEKLIMLHSCTISSGNMSMHFHRDEETWIVRSYKNRYESPVLYNGKDLTKAIEIFKARR